MKIKTTLLAGLLTFSVTQNYAQNSENTLEAGQGAIMKPDMNSTKVYYPEFGVTPELRSLPPVLQENKKKAKEGHNDMRRFKHTNVDALPQNGDPIRQSDQGAVPSRAPIVNFQGTSSNSMPEDPSGAAGPNHYVQAINTQYEIFDRNGNSLYGPSNLSNLWSGSSNSGDPIVMYDEFADRWFIMQFQTGNNGILIAISQTPDPLGSYYTYSYTLNSFPDYPKFSIWHDGYYMTANISGQNFAVFNRDKMLAGDSSAEMVAKTLSVPRNGFYSVLPADADGDLPSGPMYLYYFQDDGWSGVSSDAINVYKMETNWTSVDATVTLHQTINVDPFDSEFTSSWDDITQQGSSQKLDGIPTAMMYRVSHRNFNGYNSVVMCHTVDIDGNNTAGIRWYELRDANDGNWTVYQSGTYAPNDGLNRWCGSIAIDKWGNIGMGYAVAGSSAYPSIRYCGRRSSDPLGQMSVAEEVAIAGTGPITGANRFGDYGHLCMDPDEVTFWHTLEYGTSSGRRTRVYSFKIAQDLACDMGVTAVTAPTDGTLSGTESVSVTITNFGTDSQSNIPVSYTVNGGNTVTETYTGTIAAGQSYTYTFTQTADFSNQGQYTVVATTGLGCDMDNTNDQITETVEHLSSANVGVTAIVSPSSGMGLATETVTVTVKNFGTAAQSNFPVAYQVNTNTPVTETYTASLAAGASANYTFTTGADLSTLGTYQFASWTELSGDANLNNDTTSTEITNSACAPTSNCAWGDGFTKFQLEEINNTTTCSTDGYGDYTNMVATLVQGGAHTLNVEADYDEQFVSVWIDFNDNGVFESSEIVVTNYQHNGTGSTTINIPVDAAVGEHLLRARSVWQNPSDDPCADAEYGETEDYKVQIDSTVGMENIADNIEFQVLPTSEETTFVVNMDAQEDMTLQVINSVGQIIYTADLDNSTKTLNVNLGDVATGVYMFKLYNNDTHKVESLIIR